MGYFQPPNESNLLKKLEEDLTARQAKEREAEKEKERKERIEGRRFIITTIIASIAAFGAMATAVLTAISVFH